MRPLRRALLASLPLLGAVAALLAGTRIGPAAPAPLVRPGGVIVLDNCDRDFYGKAAYEDNLSFLNTAGRLRLRISGLNVHEELASPHRLVVDLRRNRVWVAEFIGGRLLAYDLAGKQLLALPEVKPAALAVDPATGNVWVARGDGRIGVGSTDVFNSAGRRLANYPFRGYDIAYDVRGKAIWMVERELLKVSLGGRILVRRKIADWCSVSVAVNPRTGAVWAVTRRYGRDTGRNELLGFDNEGNLRHTVPLGERVAFRVAIDPRDGAVWVTNWPASVLRFSAEGRLEAEHKLPALTAEVDPATGHLWVATRTMVVKMDRNGTVLARTRHVRATSQVWLAAY